MKCPMLVWLQVRRAHADHDLVARHPVPVEGAHAQPDPTRRIVRSLSFLVSSSRADEWERSYKYIDEFQRSLEAFRMTWEGKRWATYREFLAVDQTPPLN